MDDVPTALSNRPAERTSGRGTLRRGNWSREPEHRRRRALALLAAGAIAAVVIAIAVSAAAGGSHALHAQGGGDFFARLQTLAGNGRGSFAETESAAENAGIDRTLAYTPYVRIAGSQHRELALTFDDGPGPYTPEILSILERQNVPATFFEVGILEQYFHASTSAIVARGYTVGDHTFSHPPMSRLSPADQRAQLLEGARAVQRYGAPFPRLFRPPYGMWNSHTLALLRKHRMLMVLWSVDTNDYRLPGTSGIVKGVLAGARPGAIILLHDAGGNRSETVAALPKIIARLRARGFKLVTIPRLLLDNPPPRDQQIASVIGSGG
ncbi:MAG TPA: polysaccharide deacetylase family protein [Solirubrobacteraceae bacterium]|nr:polysaccharide deacetylase family protein [Solirubrobacteraceae bacterium]